MNDKNAVIDKIINDAQTAVEELKAQARQNAEQIVASAKKSAKAYKEGKLSGKEGRVALALERARSVDALDARRELSACKSALIDEAFTLAAKALKEDKKAYKDYITRVIKENAEDGDKVVISGEDEKVITSALIAAIAKSAKKKITLGKERGDFAGGVMLCNEKYDKNLTLEEDLRLIREQSGPLVAKALFKGE